VEHIYLHPHYKGDSLEADLAILKMKISVVYTVYVQPICLWHFSTDINDVVGQTGTVSSS
jgi:hypothetical protein